MTVSWPVGMWTRNVLRISNAQSSLEHGPRRQRLAGGYSLTCLIDVSVMLASADTHAPAGASRPFEPPRGCIMTFHSRVFSATARATIAGSLILLGSVSTASAQTTIRAVMHSDLKILDPIWTTAYIVA